MSQTRRALEEFDNQHDFERMSADILNALGYQDVEPMAPRGGPDFGRDIKFRDGDTLVACRRVTITIALASKLSWPVAAKSCSPSNSILT